MPRADTVSQHRFRFFAVRLEAGTWVIRDPEELLHLAKVLRLDAGAAVEVTDGAGAAGSGVLTTIAKSEARVSVDSESFHEASRRGIVLALGALKHGVFDEILPSLVELGVDAVHIFLQEGCEKSRLAPKAVERWERIAGQALKQCKRVHRPRLVTHSSLAAMLATQSIEMPYHSRLVLTPGVDRGLLPALGDALGQEGGAGVVLAIGSEQGLSAMEMQALRGAGFGEVHCGDGILRAVTAALAAVAAAALVRG